MIDGLDLHLAILLHRNKGPLGKLNYDTGILPSDYNVFFFDDFANSDLSSLILSHDLCISHAKGYQTNATGRLLLCLQHMEGT